MAAGRSLHIGVNRVDPGAYGGWSGPLRGCENDANDLQAVCAANGFGTRKLLTAEATSAAVLAEIDEAAKALTDGGLFVVTYSGHGGQRPDTDNEEPDALDETWVLFDRQLLDDELYERWGRFAAGARVVVVSDSCHSGSVIQAMLDGYAAGVLGAAAAAGEALPALLGDARAMPLEANNEDNTRRAPLYDSVKASAANERDVLLQARVLLLSGCQDNQTSADGRRNGLFTATLLREWDGGAFAGGYRRLLSSARRRMPPWQTPNYFALNDSARAFDSERPFMIGH